ncbi:MAG TPA: MFS transporter [Thermomicrobiaceae bacterium]|nr:MFS transporter [Thermomicrobiaceae bacterium]
MAIAQRLGAGMGPAARRGYVLLGAMTLAYGMAMAMQQNVVTNYYEDVLHFTGPQFGYITAIREVPGFLLIIFTALFFRLSIPRLTAMALVLQGVGYACFGLSSSFWTVAPWVIASSLGYHTVLQTQYALGMSLTEQGKSGSILGKMSAVNNGGTLAAMFIILVAFHQHWLSYRSTFVLAGVLAVVGAVAILRFPILRDGVETEHQVARSRFVIRRPYRYYYFLCLLDGGRQQIFFAFGLWVLVNRYRLAVPQISAILIAVSVVSVWMGPLIGRMIDRRGEKNVLGAINVAYIVALVGYATVGSIYPAIFFYGLYSLIMGMSSMGSATYLRKVAESNEIAPSLAMGVTLQHASAIVVPIAAGFVLNYVGFQVPFLIASCFSVVAIIVSRRLDPLSQRAPARVAEDLAREAAAALGLAASTGEVAGATGE